MNGPLTEMEEVNMELAIEMILRSRQQEGGTKVTVRGAAEMYGLSKSTLHRRLKIREKEDTEGMDSRSHDFISPRFDLHGPTSGSGIPMTTSSPMLSPSVAKSFGTETRRRISISGLLNETSSEDEQLRIPELWCPLNFQDFSRTTAQCNSDILLPSLRLHMASYDTQ
eukprot:CAMPEP_0184681046 /NCGR_PEP_ID=MMETSP0312-20130426/3999_1 /TAXON_ID=31354 /ORGANISM="Compsopogon coeruleus, Strain SAG 36.94" /LENGTH=167 /DNA_ID=CAMNT_0027131617 /DNA_START=177 /DNA_END=680 /DNA_ORIENTATION=+